MRWALPEWLIAVITAVLTFTAALLVGWWVAIPCLLGVPPLVVGLRWYLARARDGYLRENESYSTMNATFLLITAAVIVANILADLLYTAIDPRVRRGGTAGA